MLAIFYIVITPLSGHTTPESAGVRQFAAGKQADPDAAPRAGERRQSG